MMKLLNNKVCPWCGRKLRISELFALDAYQPDQCEKCGKFYKNDSFFFIPTIASLIFPIMIVEIFELARFLGFVGVILAPITMILLAEPIKVGFERKKTKI
jgi:hypothetical protein